MPRVCPVSLRPAPGSCGRCFEVKCDPTWIRDGYGASFDRTGACRDPSASVILQVDVTQGMTQTQGPEPDARLNQDAVASCRPAVACGKGTRFHTSSPDSVEMSDLRRSARKRTQTQFEAATETVACAP
jgi:hypothetical protein